MNDSLPVRVRSRERYTHFRNIPKITMNVQDYSGYRLFGKQLQKKRMIVQGLNKAG